MNQITKLALPLLTLGLALLGCSQADEPVVETTPVAAAPAATAATPETQSASPGEKSPDVAVAESNSAPIAAFTPPFPQRLELFEPPQRQSTARRDDEHGETVELKGFIDVDEPRVVLSIDGVISSVPAGGEKYGVQVISIEPPTVVLQRGRNRWPATLE
jgi:hypothetical protein